MTETGKKRKKPKPLRISCTTADCDAGLHCFLRTQKMVRENKIGRCRYCDADLVDWSRVHQRDPLDSEYTFQALRNEYIRHHMWHVPIDQRAANHARRKGTEGLKLAAVKRIRTSVGPAQPSRDGFQTGWSGNVLYLAQHATATCCRRCVQEWHGIPQGVELSDEVVSYFADLLMRYTNDRMPDLAENGEYVPPIMTQVLR